MPSLRARLFRFVTRRVVGPRFRRADGSVPKMRDMTDWIVKNQKVPAGTTVEPVSIGGRGAEWVRTRDSRTDRAILYLHGGGFIMGSPATHRELASRLSLATRAAVLVPDYRLAPEHPFPAAVQDTMSAYRWLLQNGFEAGRLAVGGDSAGGGLSLQALMALSADGTPLPAAAFFLSPVTDWVSFDGESYSTRVDLDPFITLDACRFSASCYVGANDPETPLLNPLKADLAGLPPLCIHVGDHELLLSDSTRLAERARACGVRVELKVWPGMWHVFQTGARFVPEARRSLEEIGRFVSDPFGE